MRGIIKSFLFIFIGILLPALSIAENNCTGATYYDAENDTCIACPAGYDYNTDAGKTDISQCQIYCDIGTGTHEYTELEYIQSTGTQFIRTTYRANPKTKIYIDYKLNATNGQQYLFGSTSNNALCFAAYVNGSKPSGGKWSEFSYDVATLGPGHATSTTVNTARHQLTLSAKYHIEQWTNVTYTNVSTAATKNTAGPIGIFGLNATGNTWKSKMNLYSFKIWDNSILVHDFIPVRRNGDDVLGLFDKIENKFYTNAGTGTFIAGPDADSTYYGACSDAGAGYYAIAGVVNYGSTNVYACPAGTTTVGYGHGADEANDCGPILHVGEHVIYTRANRMTHPSLNFKMPNGDVFYANVSTTDHTLSKLHLKYDDTLCTVYDESLFYGEREF